MNWISIINNLSFLIILMLLHNYAFERVRLQKSQFAIISGIIYSLIVVLGMLNPIFKEQIIFDGRSVILFTAGYFGGYITAAIAFVITSLARVFLGGETSIIGVIIVGISLLMGLVARYLANRITRHRFQHINTFFWIIVAHLLIILTLNIAPGANKVVFPPIVYFTELLIFPPVTYLLWLSIIKLQKDREKKNQNIHEISRLKSVVDESYNFIAIADHSGLILYNNKNFDRLKKLILSDEPKTNLSHLLFRDSSTISVAEILSNLQKHVNFIPAKFDDIFIDEQGSPLHIIWNFQGVREENRLKEVVIIGTDVTEIRKIQAEYDTSEAQFNSIFEMAADAILIGNPVGQIIKANQKAEELTGYSLQEIIGNHIAMLFDKGELERVPFRFDLLNKGIVVRSERNLRRKDGTYIPIEMNTKRMPQGTYSAIIRDFTERKKFEDTLKESEERYKKLFENANDAILLLDGTQIIDVNKKALELFGYNKKELIGKTFDQLSPEKQPNRLFSKTLAQNFIDRAYLTAQEFEWIHTSSNGKEKECIIKLSTVDISGKKFLQAIINDISESIKQQKIIEETQKQLKQHNEELIQINNQLRHALKKAEESEQLKSAFLANVSHEIRTPLNGILGFCELLKIESYRKEKTDEFIEVIERSSHHLLDLINDIIDLSKIEANQVTIQNAPFCVDVLVEDIIRLHSPTAIQKNISLRSKNLNEKPFGVNADATKVKQILNNLVNNAIKFTETGEIIVEYYQKNGEVGFLVKDTGIGIAEEDITKIFERFRQIENQLGKSAGGTGLGLAICKSLVELMGGKIMVESTLGVGTTFHVVLPIKETILDCSSAKSETRKVPKTLNLKGKKILVAEDEHINMVLIQETLTKYEATIFTAYNGEEALNFVNLNYPIDLILMDIKMPLLTGIEALVRIQHVRPEIPIVALTAYALLDEIQNLRKIGFNDVITKPIDFSLLTEVLDRFLSGKHFPKE
ncbi:MAG TPA: PAS domain S-box protein [Salinivirgaceae bacterium]|nr:PAS domain S-box protein [Salinivirgaceae bacterium]